jgi:hypothetical protein
MTTIIENCAIATVSGPEHTSGHVVIDGEYITAAGAGPAPRHENASYVDGAGCLATPGLINTHHHLYQWVTRGLAQDETLFGWLTALYPVWARLDAETVHAAAAAVWAGWREGLHHLQRPPLRLPPRRRRPAGRDGRRRARSGCASTPPAARWTGSLRRRAAADSVVETWTILAATEEASRLHDRRQIRCCALASHRVRRFR